METINKKVLEKIIFNKEIFQLRDDICSSLCLKLCKLVDNLEGLLTLLHDWNFFSKSMGRCQNSNKYKTTVDHVAIKFQKNFNTYSIRHEVLKCIHLSNIWKYKFSDNSKLKFH